MAELGRTTRSRSKAVFLFALAAFQFSLLGCCAFLARPSFRARYLLRELETLSLGHATFEDAQRLAEKIGAKPTGVCDRSFCNWSVRVGNSELPQWWRGSGETFGVFFDVKNSVVVRKGTGYGIGIETDTFFPSSVGLVEQENWGRTAIQEPVAAGWRTTDLYRYYEFTVYMTPKASAQDRQRFTAYKFNCFQKYRGCKDGRELLPVAASYPLSILE